MITTILIVFQWLEATMDFRLDIQMMVMRLCRLGWGDEKQTKSGKREGTIGENENWVGVGEQADDIFFLDGAEGEWNSFLFFWIVKSF